MKILIYVLIVFTYPFSNLLLAKQKYVPQIADPLTEKWRWTNIAELRNKSIRCIAQDNNEIMWFGLDNGIMSYNGYGVSEFVKPQTFEDFSVIDIAISKDGTVYSATTNGVFALKDTTWTKVFPKDQELKISVSGIETLDDGTILANLREDSINEGIGGVLHIKNGKDVLYISEYTNEYLSRFDLGDVQKVVMSNLYCVKNSSGNFVMNVVDLNIGKSDKIYVATSNNFHLGKIIVFKRDIGINGDLIVDEVYAEKDGLKIRSNVKTAETDDGKLWVISSAHELGIYVLENKKWSSYLLSEQFGGVNNQNDILSCSDGTLWVEGRGRIFIMKDDNWTEYKSPDIPLSSPSKFSFFESSDKRIWVYKKFDEVFRFDNTYNSWVTYLNLNFHCEPSDGSLWYLSEDGKAVVNKFGQWLSYSTKDGLIDNPVKLFATSYDEIWAVGSHGGVAATCYFDGEKWHKNLHPNLSWGIDYRGTFESEDGALWFGCSVDIKLDKGHRGGVLCLPNPKQNKENWVHHPKDESVFIPNCYGIGQSKDGRLWFGGRPSWVFDKENWEVYSDDKRFTEYIDYIENDSKGNVWFGSRHFGVFRYDGEDWETFTMEDGLPSNNIISIFAENEKSIWVLTNGGICYFDGLSWSSDIFTDDLTKIEEGGGIVKSQSGFLWFNKSSSNWNRRALTGKKSFTVANSFNTVRYTPDENPPETRITIYPKSIDQSEYASIFWDGYDFFELTSANKLQYSWRLNDGEWSIFTKEKYYSFSNLLAGEYKLEVRARDQEFNVDPTPALITFQVLKPWYKRTQFIVLVVIGLMIIAFLQMRIIKRNTKLNLLNSELKTQSDRLSEQNEQIEKQKNKLTKSLDKIQKLSQSRLRFFGNVSHEFRTPLGLILGPVEELISDTNSLDKETKNRYYQLIQRNASRILKLINQILEIYKVEESTLDYNPEKSDLVSHVKEIGGLFEPLAQQKGVDLIFKSSQAEIVFAYDLDKIEKIVFNLLSNAFKNTRNKGKIEIIVSLKELKGDEKRKFSSNKVVELEISDNGKGIQKEQLDKIFERFYHNEGGEVDKSGIGLGIGLSYIKDLVKSHQGNISVESIPEVRTTFNVSIPFINEINANENAPGNKSKNILSEGIYQAVAELHSSLTNTNNNDTKDDYIEEDKLDGAIKLLIIEDDNDTRLFLKSSFDKDFVVLEAKNGQEGILLARTENPDLVISDIMMPEMDGLQFCKILKSDFDTSHIPVILLTAKTRPEDKIEGYETGADDYLEKPFNSKILKSRVNNIIKSRNRLKQAFHSEIDLNSLNKESVSLDELFIQKAIQKVEDMIANTELDAEMLASELNVSRIQLYRKIKALTGQTVNQFIKSIRIKHAARLLVNTELTISEVAYESGFSAPNHFSTYFKQYFGCSPTEYQLKSS